MKHNKKRNTAFLYECLIKEMTKAVVRGELQKKQQIVETQTQAGTHKCTGRCH